MATQNSEKEALKAKTAAFRLLKVRSRSEQELKSRLSQKKFSQKSINQTVREFKKIGLINDIDFAKSWIRSRLNKGFGKRRIVAELRQKGITPKIIDKQTSDLEKKHPSGSMIHQLAKQRMKRYKKTERSVAIRRIYGFLLRRGFGMEDVLKEIKKI